MNQIPLNGSQIHSLEYQRGERDDPWHYVLHESLDVDSSAILPDLQLAMDCLGEAASYAKAVKLWLACGRDVSQPSPIDVLPNLPYSRGDPFSARIVSSNSWLFYDDLQDADFASDRISRRVHLSFCFGQPLHGKKPIFSVLDSLYVESDRARSTRERWDGRAQTELGRFTRTLVGFDLENGQVGNPQAIIHAPLGTENAGSYATKILKKVLFTEAVKVR